MNLMITGIATKVPMEVVRLTTATSRSRRVILFRKNPRTETMSSWKGQKILHLRFAERRLRQAGYPTRGDQRVQGRDGGGDGRGRDGERVGQQDQRPEAGEGGGDDRPPGDHLQTRLGAGIEKAGDEEAHDGQRKEPAGESSPEALLGDPVQRLDVDLLPQMFLNAGHVTRAHDRHDPGARRMADGVGEVEIALVDQGGLQPRQLFSDGLEGEFQDVVLLELLDLLLGDLVGGEEREEDVGEELHLAPETHLPPGPQERHPDLPVREHDLRADRLGPVDGPEHLLARGDVEFLGDLPLQGGHDELGEEDARPLLADHLDDVGLLPLVPLADRLVAGSAELDADRVRLLLVDDPLDQIGAFARDVGRADQDDLPALQGDAVDILVFQMVSPSTLFWGGH